MENDFSRLLHGVYFEGWVLSALGGLKWYQMRDAIVKTCDTISEKTKDFG